MEAGTRKALRRMAVMQGAQIREAKGASGNNAQAVAALDTRVGTAETSLASALTALSAATADIAALTAAQGALTTDLAAAEAALATATANIAALTTAQGALTTDLAAAETDIAAMAKKLIYSQSTHYGGPGAMLASGAVLNEDAASPFVVTGNSMAEFVQVELVRPQPVTSVILRATDTTGGWGAYALNGKALQWTADDNPGPDSSWTNIEAAMSGFTDGSQRTIAVGETCSAIRISAASAYIGVAQFAVIF